MPRAPPSHSKHSNQKVADQTRLRETLDSLARKKLSSASHSTLQVSHRPRRRISTPRLRAASLHPTTHQQTEHQTNTAACQGRQISTIVISHLTTCSRCNSNKMPPQAINRFSSSKRSTSSLRLPRRPSSMKRRDETIISSVSITIYWPLHSSCFICVWVFCFSEGLNEVPPFSTLNADIIPREDFIGSIERHMPKIETDLIKDIWRTIGVQSCDERVYKVASAMMEH